jgi:hypothetical protein
MQGVGVGVVSVDGVGVELLSMIIDSLTMLFSLLFQSLPVMLGKLNNTLRIVPFSSVLVSNSGP